MKTYKKVKNSKVKDITDIDIKQGEQVDAIYVRESTKFQAENGYNLHKQEEECIKYTEIYKEDRQVKIYRDKGASAKNIDRPALNELIEDIKAGKIKRVIVHKLDRLVRRSFGLYTLLELFEEYGVVLITVREGIKTDNPVWKMVISFFIMIAEIEQDQISERTTEALEYAAQMGSYIKGNKTPFGTRKKRIESANGMHINILCKFEPEWEIVEKIYDLANRGKNCIEISLEICNLSYMLENNIRLTDGAISNILSNKIYYGIMMHKGKEYKIQFDGCLTKEYWDQVQENRKVHLKSEQKNSYVFHSKVYCKCGMLCKNDVTNKYNASGKLTKYFYYVCPKCKKRVNENEIIKQINPKIEKKYKIDLQSKNEEMTRIKLSRAKSLRNDIYSMYLNGKIDTEIYLEEVKNIKNDISLFEKRLKFKNDDYANLKKREKNIYYETAVNKIVVNMQSQVANIIYNV